MSDESTSEGQQTEGESANVKRLREQYEALKEQNETLLGRVRLSAFKEAGIDPEVGGMAKAIYRTYDGDPDPEAIKAFATEEYGWKPASGGIPDAQKRVGAALGAGDAPDPESPLEAAAQAAAEGDWVKAGALKDAQLLALTNKKFGY